MSVCKSIKGFTRRHERIADLFPLLAVILFFATLWGVLEFAAPVFAWAKHNLLLRVPLVVLAILLDVGLMFFLLSIGASSNSEENESCLATFRGRRHGGGPSLTSAFSNWIQHIEQVGKKHR